MKLVAIVRTPTYGESAANILGRATGLTLAEARIRLAPEPPAILANLAPEAADALVAELRKEGVAAVAVERAAASEGPRVVARTVVLGPAGVSFQARTGAAIEVPWAEVATILRGASSARSETEVTEKSKQFSLSTALATQGLKTTSIVEKTARSMEEQTEQAILLYGRSGQRIILREGELEFSCLGAAMQPTRTANMAALARVFKERAPSAFYDERLLRLGRRKLPMFLGGETRVQGGKSAQVRTDTAGGLELLGEILFHAVQQGLLP